MRADELPEEWLGIGARPVVLPAEGGIAVQVEGAAAEDPAFHQIRVDAAGLLDGKVSLVDRAVAPGAEAQLVGQGRAGEELLRPRLGLAVERGVDAVALENGEADGAQRAAQVGREGLPVGLASVQEPADVAGADARFLVERFLVARFGKVVLLLLLHLVVADEGLVGGLDALGLPVIHGAHDTSPSALAPARWRRWPST